MRLLAGVDFTLRDGRVEEDTCPVDFSVQRNVVNLSLVDSPNFGSSCEQAPINPSGNPYPCTRDIRTGQNIPYPFAAGQEPPARIPRNQRLSRNPNKYKRDYVCKYHFKTPQLEGNDPWEEYQIHHIFPLEYGGTNDFWNQVPLLGPDHRPFTTYWKGWEGARPI